MRRISRALVPREEGGGYRVNNVLYGARKLSDAGLKVYLERLRELAELTRREPEDRGALVERLVRCADEPATRWEGAFEFEQSDERRFAHGGYRKGERHQARPGAGGEEYRECLEETEVRRAECGDVS